MDENNNVVSDVQEEAKVLSVDEVSSFLETEEGKRLLQPKLDSYFSNGLKTWQQNNLEKEVNKRIAEKLPSETPEQRQLRDLQNKLSAMEAEKEREILLNKASVEANQMGLSANIAKFALGSTEQETRINLMAMQNEINSIVQVEVEKRLKGKDVKQLSDVKETDPYLKAFSKGW
jgi:uncharacterized protein with von Willebrand factor type A (vWA) domain